MPDNLKRKLGIEIRDVMHGSGIKAPHTARRRHHTWKNNQAGPRHCLQFTYRLGKAGTWVMVTHGEHLKNILVEIQASYMNLNGIKDMPGGLELINKEMSKINGMIKVVLTKTDMQKIPVSDLHTLRSKLGNYMDSYSFEKEIATMAPLYSDDVYRIKNMRLKILEALDDRGLMAMIGDVIEQL